MRVIEGIEGNVRSSPELATARDRHRDRGTLEHLQIDDTQRRRSRFRATTDAGRELGVVVRGAEPLEPGDVLLETDIMVVVEVTRVPTLAVGFPSDTAPATTAKVGHAVGNRHWDLTVESGTVHVAAGPDPDARRRRLDEIVPEDATVERGELSPSAFDGAPGQDEHGHEQTDQDGHGHHKPDHSARSHNEPDHGEHEDNEPDHGEHGHRDKNASQEVSDDD